MFPSIRNKLLTLQETGLKPTKSRRSNPVLSIPDWMILYHMAQCMHEGHFSQLMNKMEEEKFSEDEKDGEDGSFCYSSGQWNSDS